MSRAPLGIIVALLGIALIVISALADAIGIGSGSFGGRQIAGLVIGGLVAIVGGWMAAGKSTS